MIYPALFEPDPEGGILVRFPDFGYATHGDDERDAYAMAQDLLVHMLSDRVAGKKSIPRPGNLRGKRVRPVFVPAPAAAKVELYAKRAGYLSTLKMALVGYQIEQERIEEKIREIHAQLKGQHVSRSSAATSSAKPAQTKRALRPAARRRIAAAQKKRGAEHRKRLAAPARRKHNRLGV